MHELGIASEILEIGLKSLEDYGEGELEEILLDIGIISGVQPDNLLFHFDILKQGTMAEKTLLNIRKIPVSITCRECGFKEQQNSIQWKCPKCQKENFEILGGKEMNITGLEVRVKEEL